jgi:hypothetical protein
MPSSGQQSESRTDQNVVSGLNDSNEKGNFFYLQNTMNASRVHS